MEPDIGDGTDDARLHEPHWTSRNAMCKRWDTPETNGITSDGPSSSVPDGPYALAWCSRRLWVHALEGFLSVHVEVKKVGQFGNLKEIMDLFRNLYEGQVSTALANGGKTGYEDAKP